MVPQTAEKEQTPMKSIVYVRTLGQHPESEMMTFLESVEKEFHVADGGMVCIKPNLCLMKRSNTGVTTDIRLISAMIDFIKKRFTEKISIVESNGEINNIDVTFKALGLRQLASSKKVGLVNLSSEEKVEVKVDGFYLKKMKMPRILEQCDYLISMGKLKTHSFTTMSGILKNQFGCIPGNKAKYHKVISEVIADVNTLLKPDFCVVDGIVALDGFGPIQGQPVPLNMILAGKDPVAVDAASATAMGFDPKKIEHLVLSERAGIGSMEYFLDGTIPDLKFRCKSFLDGLTDIFLSYTQGRKL